MYAICIPVNDGAAQSSKLCSTVTMVHVCVHVWEWDALFFLELAAWHIIWVLRLELIIRIKSLMLMNIVKPSISDVYLTAV